MARLLWTSTLVDGAINREWIFAMGGSDAASRMARLFCELYSRLSSVGLAHSHEFFFSLNQTHLSEALGISTVHVNRTIQLLRAENLIWWRSGQVQILDWDRLVKRGQFDSTYLHLKRD